MAYSTSSPAVLLTQGIGNQVPATWYISDTVSAASVQVSGYITNGGDLGMKVGDIVVYRETDTDIVSTFVVKTVSSTAPGAVDLTNATATGSGTNSD